MTQREDWFAEDREVIRAKERMEDAYFQAAYPEDFQCVCIYPDADYCPIHGYDTPSNRTEDVEEATNE